MVQKKEVYKIIMGAQISLRLIPILFLTGMLAACVPASGPAAPTLEPGVPPTMEPASPTPEAATLTPTTAPTEAPSPEPTRVPTDAPSTSITLDNAGQLQPVGRVNTGGYGRLYWSADSQSLAVMAEGDLIIYRLDPLTEERRYTLDPERQAVAVSPDGFLLAIWVDDHTLQLVDPVTGSEVQTIEQEGLYTSADFSPDGQTLAVSSINEIAAILWNLPEGEVVKTLTGFETAAPVYGFRFSTSGDYLVWLARATVQYQSIESGELSPRLSHEDFVLGLAASPDDRMLATSQGETVEGAFVPVIKLWDPLSGDDLGRVILDEDDGPSAALSFSLNADLLAGDSGNRVILWDAAGLSEAAVLEEHTSGVIDLAFSPNGASLASLDESGELVLWQPRVE
jgi:WD40 repeat protein